MSAIRVGFGEYRDPYTGARLEVGVWVPLPADDPPPIERRRATPAELARLDVPDPRPIRGVYTDAERAARKAEAAAQAEELRRRVVAIRARERAGERERQRAEREARKLAGRAARAAERAATRAAARSEAEAIRAARWANGDPRQRVTNEQLFDALRMARGNRGVAAVALGLSYSHLTTRVRATILPPDVAALGTGRGRR